MLRPVTYPRLPHVGVSGLLGLGIFFCRATIISLFPAYQEGLLWHNRGTTCL